MKGSLKWKVGIPLVIVVAVIFFLMIFIGIVDFRNSLMVSVKREIERTGQGIVNVVKTFENDLKRLETSLLDSHKKKLKGVVESIVNIMNGYYELSKSGKISEEKAKELSIELVKLARYEGTNYLWINDMKPRMVFHPIKPQLNGKDLSSFKDPNGVYLFNEMVKVCREKGEGFVRYSWPKPGSEIPVPKLSYVKLFEPWGWIVGTGVYVDDVKKEIEKLKKERFEKLREEIMSIKLGESSYPAIIKSDGTVVMYIDRSLEGKKVSFKDKKTGEDLIPMFKKNIGKIVEYNYTKPNKKGIFRKFAYVGYIPEEDWLILVTVYEDEALRDVRRTTVSFSIMGIVMILAIILILFLLLKFFLMDKTKKLVDVFEKVGRGELNVKLDMKKSRDEIGRIIDGLEKMIGNVKVLLNTVKENEAVLTEEAERIHALAERLNASAKNLREESEKIVEEANNTASSIEETTSGIEEVASSAQVVSKSSEELAEESRKLREVVKKGEEEVVKIIENIRVAEEESKETVERAKSLSEATKNIEEIVSTINAIAEQTNLLALNAAIEAARAGEAGRGFAVVADEIRKLAEESKKATEEISKILTEIREEAEKVSESNVKLSKIIEEMGKGSEGVKEAFGGIKEEVGRVDDMANDLAGSAQEQSATAEEMSAAMDSATRSINEMVPQLEEMKDKLKGMYDVSEDLAESGRKLSNLESILKKNLDKFKT